MEGGRLGFKACKMKSTLQLAKYVFELRRCEQGTLNNLLGS